MNGTQASVGPPKRPHAFSSLPVRYHIRLTTLPSGGSYTEHNLQRNRGCASSGLTVGRTPVLRSTRDFPEAGGKTGAAAALYREDRLSGKTATEYSRCACECCGQWVAIKSVRGFRLGHILSLTFAAPLATRSTTRACR